MVVPVPVVLHKEDVKTLAHDVFEHIDSLSAPRLVEYWEQDPCWIPPPEEKGGRVYSAEAPSGRPTDDGALGVKVEARFVVGEYEIVILSANDSSGLDKWLRLNKYTIPAGAAEALAPYVRQQMKFFVAKVDIKKVQRDAQGVVQLSPLRFSFESNELRLPVRLGLLNAQDKQDLIVYVLSPTSRFEAANYPNAFVPTNIDVADEVRRSFPSFYAQLFDATVGKMNGKAVVTEYAWQTTSCDPCPVPPLQAEDLVTLGANQVKDAGGFASWVVTRMHTRYDKAALSEDLLFREAKPIEGGRGGWDGNNKNDTGVHFLPSGGENNFQARYIIRHYWNKPVACKNPRYNRWGGPPDGREPGPQAAKGLAQAPRGAVKLPSVVNSAVPSLGLAGHPPPKRR
ncbi:MAG TPA: DUF2330 domain-containing protein, partial [Polyangia bacterium]|nr:DUF2330 domain-containing protein [Polyangia bacterium]